MQPVHQTASLSFNMFPPSDKTNVADRLQSLRKSTSAQQKLVPRDEEHNLVHRKEDCTLCSDDYPDTHYCHTQAITALPELHTRKCTVNYNENIIPFINHGNRLAAGAMGIKYTDRQYGTPLEPIIEHEKSYSTLRASISTAPSLRKIVKNCTPNSASIMQENERIAMSAISCVPKGRKRACGGDAAGRPIQQPATRQGRVTVDKEDHATQIAQTVAVGVAAPCKTAEDRIEKQEITIKSCADDRQSGKFSLVSDCQAKSTRCKPSVRYRLCPPPENHEFLRDQLKVPLKQVENEVQLNNDCNATINSKEHPLRTKKITIFSALGSRKRPKRIYSKYRLMRCKRSQNSRTLSHCFA